MTRPTIAVVIPTRERAETLRSALRTCVTQDYEGLEIVVSDNASIDDTRAVVDSFADPRIRYVNTGKRMAMNDNWEFGFSHVTADYATILGDDDGIVPGGIRALADLLEKHPAPAVTWQYGQYFWPTYFNEAERNTLILPLRNKLVRVPSATALRHMFSFYLGYTRGPCAYYSIVSMEAVRRVIARDGRMFAGVIPDVYSALAIASLTDSYLYSNRPFSIAGLSKHSTGTSQLATRPGEQKEAAQAFIKEVGYKEVQFSQVLGSVTAMVLDSLVTFKAQARIPTPDIPFRRALQMIVSELRGLPGALDVNRGMLETLAVRHGAAAHLRGLLEDRKSPGHAFGAARRALRGMEGSRLSPLGGNRLRVETDRFGTRDIAEACVLSGNLLGDYVVPDAVADYSLVRAACTRLINRLPETDWFLGM